MIQDGLLFLVLALSAGGSLGPRPAHADVNVGITIGTPAPPPQLVVAVPPQLVMIPGTTVYYAPSVTYDLFVFNGRYYAHHNGAWFHASTPRAGWMAVPVARVPRPLLAVPASYYKIPPGHAKKHLDGAGPNGHPRGGKARKDRGK
jgi:hypothetical protein